jgi:hypothetical protein
LIEGPGTGRSHSRRACTENERAVNGCAIALSAPLVAAEPIVDHRMSQRFRLLASAGYNFWNAFDITRMNDDSPVVPFNPGAEGVPYAPVLHYTSKC